MEDFDKKLKDASRAVKSLITITSDYLDQVESLSYNLPKLAIANIRLGKYAAYATYLARNADHAYRVARDNKKLEYIFMKWTASKAESQAFVDASDSFDIYSEAQRIADEAKDLTYRTDTFIDQARSRLSLISKEMNRNF